MCWNLLNPPAPGDPGANAPRWITADRPDHRCGRCAGVPAVWRLVAPASPNPLGAEYAGEWFLVRQPWSVGAVTVCRWATRELNSANRTLWTLEYGPWDAADPAQTLNYTGWGLIAGTVPAAFAEPAAVLFRPQVTAGRFWNCLARSNLLDEHIDLNDGMNQHPYTADSVELFPYWP